MRVIDLNTQKRFFRTTGRACFIIAKAT